MMLGCQPTFAETLDKNADGGVGYAAIPTILECQVKCISELTCVALDFDANNPNAQCWLHLDITNIAVLKDAPGVRHHQLTRDCDGKPSLKRINIKQADSLLLHRGPLSCHDPPLGGPRPSLARNSSATQPCS